MGRNWLRARSDHQPANSRIAAPPNAATASTPPADDVVQPRSLTRWSKANAATVSCGTTGSVLDAWIRQRNAPPYGDAVSWAAPPDGVAGSRNETQHEAERDCRGNGEEGDRAPRVVRPETGQRDGG